MIKNPATRSTALLALLILLPGCDLGTDPGEGLAGLEPAAAEQAVSDLLVPLQSLIEPGQLLRQAMDSLADRGVAFSRTGSGGTEEIASGLPAAGIRPVSGTAAVEFPQEIQGQTIIWSDSASNWIPDPDRTGAPAEGIRVIWYSTDLSFDVIVPVTELGYMDLTDRDTLTWSRLGTEVVSTDRSLETVLADFTQAYDTASTSDEYIETRGLYSDGSEDIEFVITLEGAEDVTTGDADLDFRVAMAAPGVEYSLSQVGTVTGSTGNTDQIVTASVVREGVITLVELDLTVTETGGQSGTGTLTHDGTVIAEITVDGQQYRYSGTNGNELTDRQKAQLDNLVRTLQSAGVLVLFNLPLLFL